MSIAATTSLSPEGTTPMTPRRFTATLAATAALALAATACGSDTTGTEQFTAPTTTAPDLDAAPAALTWRTVGGVSVPRSPIDGPRGGSGVTGSGYSQTPQGAVLAAINGQTALAVAGDRAWAEVANTVTAPGPGRDAYALARTAVTVSGTVPADRAPAFVGFEVTDYDTERFTAAVSVAQTIGGDDQLYSYPVALQWLDDDWRIVLPTADDAIDATELESLDGYTALEPSS